MSNGLLLPLVLLLCPLLIPAQQQPAGTSERGTESAQGRTQMSGTLERAADSSADPKQARANIVPRRSFFDFKAPYHFPSVSGLRLEPAERARALVRNGSLYLSLYDAIALAIENNLDVEVSRYDLSIASSDILRARGGGILRGVDYSVAEAPTGVGGPGSPLLNSAAASVTPTTPTVNDLTPLNQLTQTQTNLSNQSVSPYSTGPNIPVFDPSLVGQAGFFRRTNTTTLTSGLGATGATTGTVSALPSTPGALDFTTTNLALLEGFSFGTQVEVGLNNAPEVLYGSTSKYDPFSTPNTSVTVTQPLLRGFGRDVNLRFLKIAQINQKISRLVFYQQLISTVYGIARLYYDLVSLNENIQVKRETLAAARKLYEDNASQVQEGTLAPLELTRAQATVSASELDLIQAEGLVRQQEVILKTQLSRRGTADPVLTNLHVVPTDRIVIPAADDLEPTDALVNEAVTARPDLAQAALQVQAGELALKGAKNFLTPELDVFGNFQTRGSAESPFAQVGSNGTGMVTPPQDLTTTGLRTSRIYQAGIQLNLPLRNRVAEADAARDQLQVRQSQARTQRLSNQVREEIENSVIALQTARSALDASIRSRQYQEQLLDAERDKLSVGASTNLLVIQQAGYLAQARSTEVSARSVWIKARVALDRALGNLLEKNGIAFDDAVTGTLPH